MPIEPQLIGKIPEGFKIQSVELIPNMINVSMAGTNDKKNILPKGLRTTPIYLHGLTSNTTVYCKIVTPSGVQHPDRRWPDIEVRINVEPKKK